MKRTPLQRKTPLKAGGIQPREPKARRKKRCAVCEHQFQPERSFQAVCSSIECAIAHGRSSASGQAKARKALDQVGRQEIKVRKEKLKSRGDYAREAQIAFNAWVRERDRDVPCISCGRHHQGKYDAGHYRTTAAAPELRFEPLNVNKQCSPCNTQLSGNIVEYRISLVAKIGAEAVSWLEGPHEAKRYTIEELKEITARYRAMTRELKREQQA